MRGRDLSCGHDETLSPHRFFLPGFAHAQGVGADPAGSGPIVGALHWVQGTLMGTVATVAAVVAVACVG
jgi:type IV secretion system protein VirB2